jgi:hypothetical protein
MHFKTPKINLNIRPVECFLQALPHDPIERPGTSSVEILPASLPARRTIVILEHAR